MITNFESTNIVNECLSIASLSYLKPEDYEDATSWRKERDQLVQYQKLLKTTKRTIYSNKLNLTPYFIVGLIESDGSFFVGIEGSDFKMRPYFSIALNTESSHDEELIKSLQGFFGVGHVTLFSYDLETNDTNNYQKRTGAKFEVNTLWECYHVICRFFEQYPLKGEKLTSFLLWRKALHLMMMKREEKKKNKPKLVHFAFNINPKASTKNKKIEDVLNKIGQPDYPLPSEIVVIRNTMTNWMLTSLVNQQLPLEYVSGFYCGDGCCSISINSQLQTIQVTFSITTPDKNLLVAVKNTLGFANIFTLKAPEQSVMIQRGLQKVNDCYRYATFSKDVILNKVGPLFKNYPFLGSKGEAFNRLINILTELKELQSLSPKAQFDFQSDAIKRLEIEIQDLNRKGRYRKRFNTSTLQDLANVDENALSINEDITDI